MVKETVRVLQQERDSYSDPITEFLECLFLRFDFDGAQKKLKECDEVQRETRTRSRPPLQRESLTRYLMPLLSRVGSTNNA